MALMTLMTLMTLMCHTKGAPRNLACLALHEKHSAAGPGHSCTKLSHSICSSETQHAVLQTPTNITNTYQYSESHATASREHIENIPKKIMNRSPESILHYAERRALHLGSDHLQLRGSPSWQRSAQEPVSKSSSKTIQSMRGVSRISRHS